ncbi:MAG: hypothetical protein MR598_00060 [Erysipelotrichaceae bacterium]|nr:hypothetical protein [Erysipelotrichaceae bacterium]
MNKKDPKYENKEICKQCGGYCCKKSGCDYFVSDFESMKLDYLENILNTKRVSIIASFDFKRLNNGKLVYTPMLSLRARNNNRDIIDLLSFKTSCASLTENGCYYDIEKRPSGGVALIAQSKKNCYSEIDRLTELKKWEPYQKVLERLVKRYTKMSVIEKIKEDVENLIYNIYTKNFEEVFPEEIEDVYKMLPLLAECFPEEFEKAKSKYQKLNPHNSVKLKKKIKQK